MDVMSAPSVRADPPPIVFTEALAALEGDVALLNSLVPMMLDQIDLDMATIRAHVIHRSTEGLCAASHRLKGSLGAIAAVPAYQACSDLNRAAKNLAFESYASALFHLEQEITRLRPCLHAWIAANPNSLNESL